MENTIRVERAKKKISQAKLASEIGVSRQTIHAIENGKFIPSTLIAMKISNYFDLKIEDIFYLEKEDV